MKPGDWVDIPVQNIGEKYEENKFIVGYGARVVHDVNCGDRNVRRPPFHPYAGAG